MNPQALKLILGFLGGIALLAFTLAAKHVGLELSDMERGGLLVGAISGFGLAAHGTYKMQPPAGPPGAP